MGGSGRLPVLVGAGMLRGSTREAFRELFICWPNKLATSSALTAAVRFRSSNAGLISIRLTRSASGPIEQPVCAPPTSVGTPIQVTSRSTAADSFSRRRPKLASRQTTCAHRTHRVLPANTRAGNPLRVKDLWITAGLRP